MRLGVFSDVHGNLPALHAVLDHLASLEVDDLVCAGDLVGYGPRPEECVRLLVERGVRCVAGNHDLMAAGLLPDGRRSVLAARSLEWTGSVLSADAVDRLRALPSELRIGPVVVTHGALDDPQRYTATGEHAAAELDRLASREPDAVGLVLGHTHRQLVHRESTGRTRPVRGVAHLGTGRFVLNPGSVGQSRQWEIHPRARFAVLDVTSRTATMYAIPYDVAATAEALDRIGMPRTAMHARPGARTLARRLRRAVRSRVGSGRGPS